MELLKRDRQLFIYILDIKLQILGWNEIKGWNVIKGWNEIRGWNVTNNWSKLQIKKNIVNI